MPIKPPRNSRFPPVGIAGPSAPDLAPVDVPQYIPSSPHNLPPRRDRPVMRGYTGTAGQSLIPGADGGAGPGPVPAPVLPTEIYDPHHYTDPLEASVTLPAVANTSVQVLLEPTTRRNYLLLRNTSAVAVMYVSFGRDATANSPIRLSANQMMLLDTVVPQGDMYVMSDTASVVFSYAVGTL